MVIKYFTKHSTEYNKIWKGRPQYLEKDRIVKLLVKNISNCFVSSFIEKYIDYCLSEIKQQRNILEENGISTDEALIRVLSKSIFCDNIDLYFLLCSREYSPEYISLVKNMIPLISKIQDSDNTSVDTNLESDSSNDERAMNILEEKLNNALTRIADLERELLSEQELLKQKEEKLSEAILEKKELQTSLTIAEENLSQTENIKSELKQLQLLSRYTDTNNSEITETEYEYTSICRVVRNYSDQISLIRLADINNGVISVFEQNEDIPRYFGNRDRLFWKNGPNENNYIGIWNWNAQPNQNNPSIDYVTTTFNANLQITEIVEVSKCHNISDLTEYLLSTELPPFSGRKILFTLPIENDEIKGLLCHENNFINIDNKFTLGDSVYILPQFSINEADILSFGKIHIYRYIELGLPKTLIPVRDPMYVAKDIILSRATSAALRETGLQKKEARHCREFLEHLPTTTLLQEFAELYACSNEEAQSYINKFIEHADSYLTSTDLDISVISAALERNPDFILTCKNLLFDEWYQENEKLFTDAKKKLEKIESQVTARENKLSKLKTERKNLQKELATIKSDIQSKEQLALRVEEKVAERITSAKNNVADFICEMAFATGYAEKNISSQSSSLYNNLIVTHRNFVSTQDNDIIKDGDTFEEELAENLEKSGYNIQYSCEMAQVIRFCISNKLPLVINENVGIIADCIASMFGTVGAMEITLPISNSSCSILCQTIKENATANYNIFIINGIFDGLSLNAYNELIQNYVEFNQKVLLILSSRGLSMNMIPTSVWNQAFFIDGDLQLISTLSTPLNSFITDVKFTPLYDKTAIRLMRKELKPFKNFISNTARLNYSIFMATYNEHINSNQLLKLQLIMACQNNSSLDELVSAFADVGVNEEIHTIISRYQ